MFEAPIAEKMVDDNVKARLAWIEFFAGLTNGDVGTAWTPAITGLTSTGTPSISGVYYKNSGFTDWVVKIVPATDTTSVAGTTFIDLPFSVVADAALFAVSGTNSASGAVNAASKKAYLPAWAAITSPVTISGRVKN
jgi:hypothetical protein